METCAGDVFYDSLRTRCGIFMRSTRRIQIPQHFFFAVLAGFCSKLHVYSYILITQAGEDRKNSFSDPEGPIYDSC
jgi:hypothetical protein